MSDFLTRLAARELRTVPVLEPRIRALFEPEAGDQLSTELATPRLRAEARASERGDEPRTSDTRRPRIDQVSETTDRETLQESLNRFEPLAKTKMPSTSQAPAERPRGSRRTPSDDGSHQADTDEAAPAPLARRDPEAERVTAARDTVSEKVAITNVDRGITRPLESRTVAGLAPRRIERSDPDRSPAPELLNVVHAQRRLRPRRLVESGAHVADEGSAVVSAGIATRPLESRRPLPPPIPQESERPIHVTIGRIEVTAVTSASRDREKVKVRPRVSLDNYLAGRRKGSR